MHASIQISLCLFIHMSTYLSTCTYPSIQLFAWLSRVVSLAFAPAREPSRRRRPDLLRAQSRFYVHTLGLKVSDIYLEP